MLTMLMKLIMLMKLMKLSKVKTLLVKLVMKPLGEAVRKAIERLMMLMTLIKSNMATEAL